MNQQQKTVIFDVDGTIIDTELVMISSLKKTLYEEKGIEMLEEDLHFILGIPGREALKMIVALEDVEGLLQKWSSNVLLFSDYSTLFPTVETVIRELFNQGLKLGIVTSKTNQEMIDEFNHFNLNQYFDTIITASDTILHKPNPEPIQEAIDRLKVDKKEVIYIGDSIYDMKAAHSCGVSFGLAKWGAQNLELFSEADIIFNEPNDILKYTSI